MFQVNKEVSVTFRATDDKSDPVSKHTTTSGFLNLYFVISYGIYC